MLPRFRTLLFLPEQITLSCHIMWLLPGLQCFLPPDEDKCLVSTFQHDYRRLAVICEKRHFSINQYQSTRFLDTFRNINITFKINSRHLLMENITTEWLDETVRLRTKNTTTIMYCITRKLTSSSSLLQSPLGTRIPIGWFFH